MDKEPYDNILGEDFDSAMVDWCVQEFNKKNKNVDLKNNKYEQDLAIQIIHNKEICRANELLKKLNEMYSRKYYKHQSSFTNLYGITFTRNDFDKRYQKLINNEVYLFYLRNHVIFYGCVNWKGEDPSSWMNH